MKNYYLKYMSIESNENILLTCNKWLKAHINYMYMCNMYNDDNETGVVIMANNGKLHS